MNLTMLSSILIINCIDESQSYIFMNVYHYLLRICLLCSVGLLAGCSTAGLSGAFGTSAPSESFAALSWSSV